MSSMRPPGRRTDQSRVAGPTSQLPQIFLPDPNVLTILGLQARIAELEADHA
jgi:hypothetical protein